MMMFFRSLAILCFVSVFLSTTFFAFPVHAALDSSLSPEQLKQAIEERTKELDVINEQIVETQKNLISTESKSKTLQREISDYNYRIRQIDLGIQSSEITIEKLNYEIDSLSYTILDKEEEIELKKQAIADFLRQLQERERENTLLIFLKSKSLAESFLEVESISQLNEGLQGEVVALEQSREELSNSLNSATQKKMLTEKERSNLAVKQEISKEQKAGKQSLLSETKNQEQIFQQQLKELEAKQAQIGEAIEEIEQELREKFDPSLLPVKRPGVFVYPVGGNPILTQSYGATTYAQKAYSTKFHNGLDFGAPLGTPVLAAREGTVIEVGNNGKFQYGRYVLVEHDNGLTTLYAHLSKHATFKGKTVAAGELIGYVGNTGYSFGNHLHFSAYWSNSVILKNLPHCNCGLVPIGVTINPADYL